MTTRNKKVARESADANAETVDLGMAMLIAESEQGGYEPVSIVLNVAEAREVAQCDLNRRMRLIEQGGDTVCPVAYAVWARGFDGGYRRVAEVAL